MQNQTPHQQERMASLMTDLAKNSGRDALLAARETLKDAVRNLDRYIDGYEQAENNTERAQQINWAINHMVCNIQGNLRIDILADCQAKLTKYND